ncbi:hypothetical protein DEAC_c19520 [Desulfosporosinus acididurans]|uniref:Thioredoxin n=1 Tax=Desulfosporosinus acididurans TaxID=476652 RepID=A0A0J1FSF3_9FIRM|nr:thioredoxin family protein [Desulfosporosinus acididurans]KLU65913.1 hypothetical protein DEAC_c19520 [Desulfosporosinus acididurans]
MNGFLTKKIILFTLNACPMGRSMGTVLHEVAALFPVIKVERVYVEIQVDEANQYRIKTNPTILFVDENGRELYRLEGFHETDIVIDTLEKINEQEIDLMPELAGNEETVEKYVLYLPKNGEFSPTEVNYKNRTSIKAPRITAVTLLIKASIEGFSNPFPQGTTLELIQFREMTGIVTLKSENVEQSQFESMKEALRLTLSQFGIKDVEIILRKSSE